MVRHHITIDVCPVCHNEETAVGDLNRDRWHCFSCDANGNLELTLTVDPSEDLEPA